MYKLRNCDSKTSMWKDYLKKLLRKANALTVALESPTVGFYQFFKDDLRREVSREVEGESNTEDDKLKRVANLFIYVLNDPENWPKRCLVDSDDVKQVVAYVVIKTRGYLSPYLIHKEEELQLVKMKISNLPDKESYVFFKECSNCKKMLSARCHKDTKNFKICNVSREVDWLDIDRTFKPSRNGKLIYMEINPKNEYLDFAIQPVDVLQNPSMSLPLWLGCWDEGKWLYSSHNKGKYVCPTPHKTSGDSPPTENRFFLFCKPDEPNYPKDESEEGS